MKTLLRTKTWLLFLVIFSPVLLYIILAGLINWFSLRYPLLNFLLVLIMACFIYGWGYLVSTGIYKLLVAPVKSIVRFDLYKYHIRFLTAFTIALFIGFIFRDEIRNNSIITYLMIPISIHMLYSVVYIWYFLAKVLSVAEGDANPSAMKLFGLIIALIYLPIGIWYIQPRIYKLLYGTSVAG